MRDDIDNMNLLFEPADKILYQITQNLVRPTLCFINNSAKKNFCVCIPFNLNRALFGIHASKLCPPRYSTVLLLFGNIEKLFQFRVIYDNVSKTLHTCSNNLNMCLHITYPFGKRSLQYNWPFFQRFFNTLPRLRQHAREMERDARVISISLFPMQPWIDVREGGWGVVAYAEGDPSMARRAVRVLAEEAWRLREEFWVSDRVAPNLAVQRAAAEPGGLVLLSDMGDAVYAGGPGDSTCVLGELWRQKVPVLSCMPLVDPVAVRQALDRGLGSIDLSMGGKTDPASRPISLHGRVTAISGGLRIVTEKGQTDLGRTALFEAGNLRIVLAEHRSLALIQPVLFTHLGLDLEKARIVVMKTGSNFQFFDRWRRKLIRVDSPGVTQSDLKALSWTHLPRPLYPLDDLRCWDPEGLIHE